jgi:hypothetical protein
MEAEQNTRQYNMMAFKTYCSGFRGALESHHAAPLSNE